MDAPIEKQNGLFYEASKTVYGRPLVALKDGYMWRVAYPCGEKDCWFLVDPIDGEGVKYVRATELEIHDMLEAVLLGPPMKLLR